MKTFLHNLITTWWGITIIVVAAVIIWILLSALLYRQFFKRFYDIILSGMALLVLSPLLLILTVLGAIKMKGNPFFTQLRPGKISKKTGQEKIFKLIKFRTMMCEKDEEGNLLPDEKRLTKYGKVLRSTSLDELPELINVFSGKMSLVGPRPLLVKDLVFMTDEIKRRHLIRGGITGLAQVKGRNNITWQQKFDYDLSYVNKLSLGLDIKILFATVFKVLKRSDIAREGTVSDIDYGDWLLQELAITEEEYKVGYEKSKNILGEKIMKRTKEGKSLWKKMKCAIRKWMSAKVIPLMVLNSWRIFFYKLCGYQIGKNVFIGMRCYLDDLEPKMFRVEDNVTISYGCYFACHGKKQQHTPITIKKGAYLGMRANVISGKTGVIIGEDAVIGACSLVLKNIEAGAVVAGVPAKRINYE